MKKLPVYFVTLRRFEIYTVPLQNYKTAANSLIRKYQNQGHVWWLLNENVQHTARELHLRTSLTF